MIDSTKFDLIRYRKPLPRTKGSIDTIIGADSEAYHTGEPFLFCFSDGNFHTEHKTIIQYIWNNYQGENIGFYNLKYDSGAILYSLTNTEKLELWEKNELKFERENLKIKIEYIPHKALIFSRGKIKVRIWDIFQYYKTGLDKAAKRYLNKSKGEIETKTFTPDYVAKNFKKIKKYCMLDAQLCGELGTYFVQKMGEFGIYTSALYSGASLSYCYFSDKTRITNVYRYWKNYPELLAYALDSYQGGKFEVTARGKFIGYEYDIVSAYPYEIARLKDISLSVITKNNKYDETEDYGFYRVKIKNPDGLFLPCGIMQNNVRIYPMGEYFLTITHNELSYLYELGLDPQIFSAYHLHIPVIKYPYKKVIDELFTLKAKYKNNDDMLCSISKLMMNSFYGKTCQLIEHWTGIYNAGQAWNPIHASVITANTRIKVSKIQNQYTEKCLGVHTDSVILTSPLDIPDKPLLGDFDLQYKGEGLILACGMYTIDDKEAYKGFVPLENDDWYKILSRHKNQKKFSYPSLRVESWTEAVSKGHFDKINYFQESEKIIDCNVDIKRTWLHEITAGKLLKGLEQSIPRLHIETNIPPQWSIDYDKKKT